MKPRSPSWSLFMGFLGALGLALLLFLWRREASPEPIQLDPNNPTPYYQHRIKTEWLPNLTSTVSSKSRISQEDLIRYLQYLTDEDCEVVFAALTHSLPHVRLNAVRVCRALETRAQPAAARLVEMLRESDTETVHIAADALKRLGPLKEDQITRLIALFGKTSDRSQAQVVAVLQEQGPRANGAAPLMLEAIRGEVWPNNLLEALEKIAPDALPMAQRKARVAALIKDSGDFSREMDNRQKALARLIEEGQGDPDAMSHLLTQGSKPTPLQKTAIRGLGKQGVASPEVVKVLVQVLRDTKERETDREAGELTQSAADALVELTPKAPAAIMEELAALLQSPEAGVRWSALGILERTAVFGKPAVAALQKCLDDKDSSIANQAVHVLGAIGPDAHVAAPALALKLHRQLTERHDYHEDLPGGAERAALKKMGPGAVRLLEKCLSDSAPLTRRAALVALIVFGEEAKQAVPAMILCLTDQDEKVRGTAIICVGELAAVAPTAVTALTRQLKEDSLPNRIAAAQALRMFGSAAQPALPEARTALQHRDGKESATLRVAAADLLAAMKPKEEAALADLVAACKDETPAVRFAAARAAWLLGKHPVVEPTMLALAKAAPDPAVAAQACAWLWREHKNSEASACLLALFKERLGRRLFGGAALDDVEMELARALLVLGPEGEAAGKVFVKALLESPGSFIRFSGRGELYRSALNAVGPTLFEEPLDRLRKAPGYLFHLEFFSSYGGPAAKDAVPELIRNIKLARKRGLNRNSSLTACIEGLHAIGPDSKAAVPELIDLWKEATAFANGDIAFYVHDARSHMHRLQVVIPAIDPIAAKKAGIPGK